MGRLEGLTGPAATAGMTGWQAALAGLNPILGSVLRLFGGGSESVAVPLAAAPRPEAKRYEFGFESSEPGYFQIDRDASSGLRERQQAGQPTVIVNVDTIDSRSFLERTPEIAEAVRRAVLEAEGLRGVLESWRE